MKLVESNSLRYYSFDSMEDQGVMQAVFSRHGGVSNTPYATLNTGGTVGDDPKAVVENRMRCFSALGRSPDSMFDVWQVHSVKVAVADAPRPADRPHDKADIIITDKPGISIFMRFADCVPVFLIDPRRKAIGMVHAGWIGTLDHAVLIALQAMQARFGSHPGDMLAGIGPSIGVDHYLVGDDVIARVKQVFPADARDLLVEHADGFHFDLWKANLVDLHRAGVRHVENSGICTACHLDDWYSHRAEFGKTGRFGALLALSGNDS